MISDNVTYIFWQTIICQIQSSFLRSFAELHDVILVVDQPITAKRLSHGWHVPELGKVQIIVAPEESIIQKLFEIKNAVHIVSGLVAFKLPKKAFMLAVKKGFPTGVFLESFNWMGWKGILRFLKYWLLNILYGKNINFILTTGNRARWCYETAGFLRTKIFDWAYFTETPTNKLEENSSQIPKLLFVGSIDSRKNIMALIKVCKKNNLIDYLSIIGIGPLEVELRKEIENTECKYWGKVPNLEVSQKLAESDLLILPSIYDGWGAVVNEALLCGTPVLASDNCGASILLEGDRGRVFSIKKNDLETALCDFIKRLPYSIDKRADIRNWALQNITGEVAANYFHDIVEFVFKKNCKRPVAPWIINKK